MERLRCRDFRCRRLSYLDAKGGQHFHLIGLFGVSRVEIYGRLSKPVLASGVIPALLSLPLQNVGSVGNTSPSVTRGRGTSTAVRRPFAEMSQPAAIAVFRCDSIHP